MKISFPRHSGGAVLFCAGVALAQQRRGDAVVVTCTEALAISVEKVPKKANAD